MTSGHFLFFFPLFSSFFITLSREGISGGIYEAAAVHLLAGYILHLVFQVDA